MEDGAIQVNTQIFGYMTLTIMFGLIQNYHMKFLDGITQL